MKISDHFSKTLASAIRAHGLPNKTKESQKWFQDAAQELGTVNKQAFLRDQVGRPSPTPKSLEIGNAYVFNYDPKHKLTLDVYDTFPLVFPFSMYPDRFYGLNMHYLPLGQRAQLMDVLDSIKNNKRYDTSTKLNISWKILQEVAKRDDYEPTIHCYLKKHIKSKVKYILPIEWHFMLTAPLAKFRGPDAARYAGMQ